MLIIGGGKRGDCKTKVWFLVTLPWPFISIYDIYTAPEEEGRSIVWPDLRMGLSSMLLHNVPSHYKILENDGLEGDMMIMKHGVWCM